MHVWAPRGRRLGRGIASEIWISCEDRGIDMSYARGDISLVIIDVNKQINR